MKIKEKFHNNNDGTFTVEKQFDNTPYLERTQMLRSMGAGKLPESWCVGSIPMHLLAQWMKEEKVAWNDIDGRRKLILRKLNDPDFKKLRIVEGKI